MTDERRQLEVLADLRRDERDEAEQSLAERTAAAVALRKELERLEAALDDLRARAAAASDDVDTTDIAGLQRAAEYRSALEIEAERLQEIATETRANLDDARATVRRAREELARREAALEAVDSRIEAHAASERQRHGRRREAEQDDIALRRWKEQHE